MRISPYVLLSLCAFFLLLSLRKASSFSSFTKVTLQGQIFFMTLPFVVQPFLLLRLRMYPSSGDWFADRRLVVNGNYEYILSKLLLIVLFSVISFYVCINVFLKLRTKAAIKDVEASWDISLETLYIMLFIGVIVLVLSLVDISNPVLFALRKVGSTTTCFSLIFADRIKSTSKQKAFFYIIGSFLTIAESIGFGFSKAPILALGISIWIFTSSNSNISKWLRISVGFFLTVSLPILFKIIQSYHLGIQTLTASRSVFEKYPEWMSFFLPFFQRFDLLSSLTDAYYAGVGKWISITDYLREIYSALLWNYGFSGLNFGARWAKEVSSQSIAGNAYTGVSLSQGPMAEGYIVLGILGAAIVSGILISLTLTLCENSRKKRWVAIVAVSMFARNSLFEQGLVGNSEQFTEALKVLVVFISVQSLVSLARKS